MALNADVKPVDMAVLRDLSDDELRAELTTLREAQFRLRFRSATEDISADNPVRFRTMRRNVARIETVLRERKQA
jgi:large subunit ribosomal protein L29